MQTRSPRAASRVIPGETPQELAARLGLPCEIVPTPRGCVIVVGRLSQEQVDATHRHMLRMVRESEPAPVPEAVTA